MNIENKWRMDPDFLPLPKQPTRIEPHIKRYRRKAPWILPKDPVPLRKVA